MSRKRALIALALVAAVAALVVWQRHREALMLGCLERGGSWNGQRSVCQPTRLGPILRRALDRT